MGGLTSTLQVDGVEVERGSVEAIEYYERLLREAYDKLNEALQLLAYVPEVVQPSWRKLHSKADRAVYTLTGVVGPFREDFAARGIEKAVIDAQFRKHLK